MSETLATQKINPDQISELDAYRTDWRRGVLSLSVGVCGLAISLIIAWVLWAREGKLIEARFRLDAAIRIESLQRVILEQSAIVNGLSAFFSGSLLVERKEFRTFLTPIMKHSVGMQALTRVVQISAAQREQHEQAVGEQGFSGYQIRQCNGDGRLTTADRREEYYPILFAEPEQDNSILIGLDMGVCEYCRIAINRATSTDQMTAVVGPPLCVKESGDFKLYLIAPARNENEETASRPADQPQTSGFILGIFNVGEIVEFALGDFKPVGIDLFVSVPSLRGGMTPVYAYLSSPNSGSSKSQTTSPTLSPPRSVFSASGIIDVADSHWVIDCIPTAAYLSRDRSYAPTAALLVGLLITGLLVGHTLLLYGRTSQVERLVAEQTRELYESEQRFRRLVENAADAFFLHDDQGRILDVNQRACDSLGYSREELLSMNISDMEMELIPRRLDKYWNLPVDAYPVTIEGIQRRKNGEVFPVEIRLTSFDAGRRLILALARDITDRKRAETLIRQEQRLLRELLELHERDRKLVAFEIHDGLSQQISASLYQFQAAEHLSASDPETSGKMHDEAMRILREAMVETRRLISGLRPPGLDESGVVAAVDCLVEEQRHRGEIEIEFLHAEFGRLSPPLEIAIFRIAQECLANACRHSQSKKVRLELTQIPGLVQIDVQDWGIGFVPEAVQGDHFGLRGIRERARLLGGRAAIESAPDHGTHIVVELPLVKLADNETNNDV